MTPPRDGQYDVRSTGGRETWKGGRLVAFRRMDPATEAERLVRRAARLKPFGHYPDRPASPQKIVSESC